MLWKKEVLNEFKSSKGNRQGDHIPLYLCVLCIGHLFHIIELVVTHKLWKLVCLSRGGSPLSFDGIMPKRSRGDTLKDPRGMG
uniref:Reverse transcriptase domain-containing protein n=1 Tax=Cajanus cajan TaxID=3821 RepID=A0A151SF30_CAJCA|nr:hypothetical protein KK1_024577 [Cajanus cajan]KYP53448.1 hypothetical protein KK1_024585 [Cajanus cajan]